jgi:hypothetical protein
MRFWGTLKNHSNSHNGIEFLLSSHCDAGVLLPSLCPGEVGDQRRWIRSYELKQAQSLLTGQQSTLMSGT